MFKKIIPSSLIALAVIAGLGTAIPETATAGGRNLSLTLQGPHGSLTIGERAHYSERRRHGPRFVEPRRFRNVCTPRKAVYKAANFGVRRAHIARVGHRLILVEGRKRGRHVKIDFVRNSRHCKVAFVNRGRNYRSDYGFGDRPRFR